MVAHEKGEFNPVAFAPFLNNLVNEATASGFRKKKKIRIVVRIEKELNRLGARG